MGCSPSQANASDVERKAKTTPQIMPGLFINLNEKAFTDVYSVGRSLGTGTFGEVKFCTHLKSNSRRAVKIFMKDDLTSELFRKKFEKEIEILKSLDHPNIVRVFEFFEDKKKLYIVMEHCRGGELFNDIMKNKKYSESDTALIMRQIFSALSYMHGLKIAHRDLKPENLLFDEKSELASIKLIDFGSATNFSYKPMKESIGTSYYMSPELISGSYSEKSDLWSAGVILHILIVGSPPFTGSSTKEICSSISKTPYNFETLSRMNVSSELQDLMSHLMVPESSRYSALQVLDHPWIKKHSFAQIDLKILAQTFHNLSESEPSNLLKSAVKTFICTQILTIDQTKHLNELFKALDENGDGKLSKDEILSGFSRLLPAEEAKSKMENIMAKTDIENTGFITYTEFIQGALDKEVYLTKENITQAFEVFDKDGSGSISADELRAVLSQNQHIDDSIWMHMVRQLDSNGDGVIDMAEFEALFKDD